MKQQILKNFLIKNDFKGQFLLLKLWSWVQHQSLFPNFKVEQPTQFFNQPIEINVADLRNIEAQIVQNSKF